MSAMSEEIVTVTVELTPAQAWQLAQFLKRSSWEQYRQNATSDAEARLMIDACHRLMYALAEKGYAPR